MASRLDYIRYQKAQQFYLQRRQSKSLQKKLNVQLDRMIKKKFELQQKQKMLAQIEQRRRQSLKLNLIKQVTKNKQKIKVHECNKQTIHMMRSNKSLNSTNITKVNILSQSEQFKKQQKRKLMQTFTAGKMDKTIKSQLNQMTLQEFILNNKMNEIGNKLRSSETMYNFANINFGNRYDYSKSNNNGDNGHTPLPYPPSNNKTCGKKHRNLRPSSARQPRVNIICSNQTKKMPTTFASSNFNSTTASVLLFSYLSAESQDEII